MNLYEMEFLLLSHRFYVTTDLCGTFFHLSVYFFAVATVGSMFTDLFSTEIRHLMPVASHANIHAFDDGKKKECTCWLV